MSLKSNIVKFHACTPASTCLYLSAFVCDPPLLRVPLLFLCCTASSMADADMSVMSASDLTSIGFDSTVDCDTDAMLETPVRNPDRHRDAASNMGGGGGKGGGGEGGLSSGAGAAGDVTDLLSGLLRAPIQRGLMLLIEFMNAQGTGMHADEARSGLAGRHHILMERCSEMATLALKRDVLSRAAALRGLVSKVPAMVQRREYAGVLTELRKHACHIEELHKLREQFLSALTGLQLPLLPSVERVRTSAPFSDLLSCHLRLPSRNIYPSK